MNPSFWLAASFYAIAGVWTLFVAWPFMRDTRHAAVTGLRLSIHTSEALDAIVSEVRALASELRACTADVDRERFNKLLKAVESIPDHLASMKAAGVKDALRKL
jgi:hypothetical protein